MTSRHARRFRAIMWCSLVAIWCDERIVWHSERSLPRGIIP